MTREQNPLSLRAVYLREGNQWMSDDFDPMLPDQELFGQFRTSEQKANVQEAVENIPDAEIIRSVRFTSNFEFRYVKSPATKPFEKNADENDLVATISARITVDYLIKSSETPSKEKLKQWGLTRALPHCWPYWREFCHSTLARMNLPITLMPMMELNPTKD